MLLLTQVRSLSSPPCPAFAARRAAASAFNRSISSGVRLAPTPVTAGAAWAASAAGGSGCAAAATGSAGASRAGASRDRRWLCRGGLGNRRGRRFGNGRGRRCGRGSFTARLRRAACGGLRFELLDLFRRALSCRNRDDCRSRDSFANRRGGDRDRCRRFSTLGGLCGAAGRRLSLQAFDFFRRALGWLARGNDSQRDDFGHGRRAPLPPSPVSPVAPPSRLL